MPEHRAAVEVGELRGHERAGVAAALVLIALPFPLAALTSPLVGDGAITSFVVLAVLGPVLLCCARPWTTRQKVLGVLAHLAVHAVFLPVVGFAHFFVLLDDACWPVPDPVGCATPTAVASVLLAVLHTGLVLGPLAIAGRLAGRLRVAHRPAPLPGAVRQGR